MRKVMVAMCDIETGEEIRVFDSMLQVEQELHINHSLISKAVRGILKTCHGYTWKIKTFDELDN